MKKRSVLMTVLAMVLVAVISVGGTLAYLTDDDTEVVNTFKFANGMEVTITEKPPVPQENEKVDPKDPDHPEKGYEYTNVVPGQMLDKQPEVKTKTSVDAYVFVKVSGTSADLKITDFDTTTWKLVDGTGDGFGGGIYYRDDVAGMVDADGNGVEQPLGTLFTKVQVGSTLVNPNEATTEQELNIGEIKIEVFEIQRNGIEPDAAITEAQNHFNASTPTT